MSGAQVLANQDLTLTTDQGDIYELVTDNEGYVALPIINFGISKELANGTPIQVIDRLSSTIVAEGAQLKTLTISHASPPNVLQFGTEIPAITVSDTSVTEGNSGTKQLSFTINLSTESSEAISFQYETTDESTIAGRDYLAKSGTSTFAANQTSKTINIPIIGDDLVEGDETFKLIISNPTNAILADGVGIGTILNDDIASAISINDSSITEGNSTTKQLSFNISLSMASASEVRVDYQTEDVTANGGQDFEVQSGTLTIPANQTSGIINIPIKGDTTIEDDEIFKLILANPSNAIIANDEAVGTIINDDENVDDPNSQPVILITDSEITEGNSGAIQLNFTVSLSEASSQQVTVNYRTEDDTALEEDNDYQEASGILSFNPGESTKQISVTINGDQSIEPDEHFDLILSSPTNATLDEDQNQAIGTILNDDQGDSNSSNATLSINDRTKKEGTKRKGWTKLKFVITLSSALSESVFVTYETTDGTALKRKDYKTTSAVAMIPAGKTSAKIIVKVKSDKLAEEDETFYVNLSNPLGADIGKGQGTGTILNDD